MSLAKKLAACFIILAVFIILTTPLSESSALLGGSIPGVLTCLGVVIIIEWIWKKLPDIWAEKKSQDEIYGDNSMAVAKKTVMKKKPKAEPGLFQKFSAYVAKNRAANAKSGEPSLTDEFSKMGADWGKNLTKGMAEVGRSEEEKLSGKTKKPVTGTFQDDDDYAQDTLFGGKKTKPVSQPTQTIRNDPLIDDGEIKITFLESGKLIIQRSSGSGVALDKSEQMRVYTLLKKLIG
jgi:hypothetical protein